MIRLIAADMDGTLLNPHSDLTRRTIAAARRAMDAGVFFTLSSGRMPEAMVGFAEALKLNAPMILFNGAMIYDPRDGRTLFSNPLPADTARNVARMLEELGIYVQCYPGNGYYCQKRCEHTRLYEQSIRVTATELGTPVSEWIREPMIKLLAIAPPEQLDPAKAALEKAFPEGVSFMKSRPHFLEIVSQSVDKAVALKALGRQLGVEREEMMAFGDGLNDVSMVKYAGTGVCMENGFPECKAAAQLIAPSNAQDGVAQVIERYLDEGRMGRSGADG